MLIKPLTVIVEPTTVAYALQFNTQDLKVRYSCPICAQFCSPNCVPNLQPMLKIDSLKVSKPLQFLLDL